jgi:transposase
MAVYQLPPYSPDLNPIEGVRQKVKEDTTHLR